MIYKNNEFMKIALNIAKDAMNNNEVPIGALLVRNNNIICSSHNLTISSGIVTRHAEIIVIEMASKALNQRYLYDCDLYVTVEPCDMCMNAIYLSRISRVYFGAQKKKEHIYSGHTEVYGQILALESELLLKQFFSSRRDESGSSL